MGVGLGCRDEGLGICIQVSGCRDCAAGLPYQDCSESLNLGHPNNLPTMLRYPQGPADLILTNETRMKRCDM